MEIVYGILKEAYVLMNRMSPYLVFGFLFAGVLHVFIKPGAISKYLGKDDLSSVIKASLSGVPLPLCSCSVIPVAMSLRKEGASTGAVLSFLISTPTTGVDSIFATYSLLGGVFTVYRIAASVVIGTVAGLCANIFSIKSSPRESGPAPECRLCAMSGSHVHTVWERMKGVLIYAFGDLLHDSGPALVAGILAGGVIVYFMPEGFIASYLGSGIKSMVIMLFVGIPMYVCATASIPIAAALMLKGMDPGAALVFLVAGPATNMVTMAVVLKNMGRAALSIYLGSIAIGSVALGILLNKAYEYMGHAHEFVRTVMEHRDLMPGWIGMSTSIVLILLIIYNRSPFNKHRMH